jgi:CheY-like chemotaxis protein
MTLKLQRTGCFEAQADVEVESSLADSLFCADFDVNVEPGWLSTHSHPISSKRKCIRVLIIDDNVDAAESLRDLFLLGDHRVEVAYDGATGIAKAKRFHPDLVMCDIALPGMDGYQVARAIREAPALAKSRLVAWTGYVRPEDIRRCAEAGFHGCMAKPLTPGQLARLLNYAANC